MISLSNTSHFSLHLFAGIGVRNGSEIPFLGLVGANMRKEGWVSHSHVLVLALSSSSFMIRGNDNYSHLNTNATFHWFLKNPWNGNGYGVLEIPFPGTNATSATDMD